MSKNHHNPVTTIVIWASILYGLYGAIIDSMPAVIFGLAFAFLIQKSEA